MTRHLFSVIAPQHPRNPTIIDRQPGAINKAEGRSRLYPGEIARKVSLVRCSHIPKPRSAAPSIYKTIIEFNAAIKTKVRSTDSHRL